MRHNLETAESVIWEGEVDIQMERFYTGVVKHKKLIILLFLTCFSELLMSKELRKISQVTEILSYVDTIGMEIPPEYLDSESLSMLQSENYRRFVITVSADYEGQKTFELVENLRKTADKYYPQAAYVAGEGVSAYDLMDTITADMVKVNLLAVGAVFLVLLLTMKSISIPVILVLGIETAIWLNLAVPYFTDEPVYYIAYLIISSVQLGATVDYAILLTERYKENRGLLDKKQSVIQTISDITVSILTSGSALTVVGFLLGLLLLFDNIVIGKKRKKSIQEVVR